MKDAFALLLHIAVRSELPTVLLAAAVLSSAMSGAEAQIRRPDRSPETRFNARLNGRTVDQDARPLAGVLVVIRYPGRPDGRFDRAVMTDPSGRFSFTDLAPGDARLSALRTGYRSLPISIDILPGRSREIDLTLEFQPSTPTVRLRRPEARGGRPPPTPAQAPAEPLHALARERLDWPLPASRPMGPLPPLEAEFEPLGHVGEQAPGPDATPDFIPRPDRWRIGLPRWERYQDAAGTFPYATGRRLDPYNQNVLKGDYAVLGKDWFLNLEFDSEALSEFRRLPVVGPPSANQPDGALFFSQGEQYLFVEQVSATLDFFKGYAAFKPFDIRFRITPAFNVNYLDVREVGLVNIDLREGVTRTDVHASLEEAFLEVKLAETSPSFDFLSVRAGTQFFNSDFRGFIFRDNQPGIRIFGNRHANKHQYNLAYFYMLEKDTNSLLNIFTSRRQHVAVANYYIQDFIKPGYTTQFSVHFNNDRPSVHFNVNDVPVRPAPVSSVVPKSVNAVYFGWAGDGHFGALNINHAFYQVVGQEKPNQIAGDVFGPADTDINAQMFALELSLDRDWRRYRGSFYYASGDSDPVDDTARGFDAIIDEPVFAGGEFSFWNRQEVRLTGTAVGLLQRFSLNPSLRSSKEEGQSNFVNPGLLLFNGGIDAKVTPKLKGSFNVNVLSFAHTEVLENLLFQSDISRFIGTDLGFGVEYRPWLNNNFVIIGGAAALIPGQGFRDVFTSESLLSTFVELRLTY